MSTARMAAAARPSVFVKLKRPKNIPAKAISSVMKHKKAHKRKRLTKTSLYWLAAKVMLKGRRNVAAVMTRGKIILPDNNCSPKNKIPALKVVIRMLTYCGTHA